MPDSPPLLTVRFGDDMLRAGYTSVPNLVLRHYAALGVTNNEMMFTIHVWSFWWSEQKPFPAYKTIGERMGLEWRAIQRYAKSLEGKGLLRITPRVDASGANTSAELDFDPLIRAIREKALHAPVPHLSKTTGGDGVESDRGVVSKRSGEKDARKKPAYSSRNKRETNDPPDLTEDQRHFLAAQLLNAPWEGPNPFDVD